MSKFDTLDLRRHDLRRHAGGRAARGLIRWRVGLSLAACGVLGALFVAAPSAGATEPSVTLGYFTGSDATPATIIGTSPSLEKTIPAKITWSPVTAGVTALAEMEAGSLDAITGVGNPPVVGAIGNKVNVDVVWAGSLTASDLVVSKSVTKPSQLVGLTLGDLEGSSTDFQLRGWLSVEHLTSKVTVDGFPSTAAVAAAFLAGKLQGAYVPEVQVTELEAKGGHVLVSSKQIAAVGYGGINVLAVAHSLIQSDPSLVQSYVCATLTATNDILGPDSPKYFAASAKMLGVPVKTAQVAGKATVSYYITPAQQKSWLEGTNGSTAGGKLTSFYLTTAKFDLSTGRITSLPSKALIASHIDATFANSALAGHCS